MPKIEELQTWINLMTIVWIYQIYQKLITSEVKVNVMWEIIFFQILRVKTIEINLIIISKLNNLKETWIIMFNKIILNHIITQILMINMNKN